MNYLVWSSVLTAVGLLGFYLTGQKVWWGWWINVANQIVWFAYAIVSEQWPFLVGVLAYTFVFTKNAIKWTRERDIPPPVRPAIGRVVSVEKDSHGISIMGEIDRSNPEGAAAWARIKGIDLVTTKEAKSRFIFPRRKGSW